MAGTARCPPLSCRRRSGREDESLGGLGALETSSDVLPVDDVPPCLDVVGLDVLVLQVEGVLPHVELEQRDLTDGDVALLVEQLHDVRSLGNGVPREDRPAGALDRVGVGVEVGLELLEAAEVLGDGSSDLAVRLATAVGAHVLPEDGVVRVSTEVEGQVLLHTVEGGVVARLAQLLQLGHGRVGAVDVGLVVLAVVQLHDPRADVRLEGGVVVVELGKRVSHLSFLSWRPSGPDHSMPVRRTSGRGVLADRSPMSPTLAAPPVDSDSTGALPALARSLPPQGTPSRSRTSSPVIAPESDPPSSTTRWNRSRLRSCSATTFSSMVPADTRR